MKRVLLNHTPTIHLRVLLNRAPSSTQLHPPPPSSFQPPPSFLQHPQQYLNQNIARYWAISPNLGRKIKNVCFNWKMVHLVYWRCFWNFDLKIHIWANLGPKIQSCLFCLKIGAHSISRMLIPNPDLDFWNSNLQSIFGQNWAEKFKVVHFDWKLAHMVYRGCWFLFRQYFFELPNLNPFLGKFGLKKSKLFVLPENWHTRTHTHNISKMLIFIPILVFSNFKPKFWGCWFLFWD